MSNDLDSHPDLPGRPGTERVPGREIETALLRRMNIVRKILVVVIGLMILREVISCLTDLIGAVPALISGVLVFAVQLFCSRLAKANLRYYSYILIPTLLFTVFPIAVRLWNLIEFRKDSASPYIWTFGPEVITFVLPVMLLLIAFWITGRTSPRREESDPSH